MASARRTLALLGEYTLSLTPASFLACLVLAVSPDGSRFRFRAARFNGEPAMAPRLREGGGKCGLLWCGACLLLAAAVRKDTFFVHKMCAYVWIFVSYGLRGVDD